MVHRKFLAISEPVQGLLSTSALLLTARVVGLGAGFATQILLARLLSPEGLGIFYFATSIAYVVSMVAAFGYPVIAVRFISRYRMSDNNAMLAAFITWAQRDTAIVAFGAMIVVLTVAAAVPGDATTRLAVAVAAFGIPACALSRINASVAGAIRQFTLSYVPDLLWRPLMFLLAMGLFATFFSAPSPIVAAAAFSVIAVIIVALQFIGLSRHVPNGIEPISPHRRLVYQWRVASAPLLILAAFTTLINDLNVSLLGMVLPKADLAVLGVCLKLTILVDFAVWLIHQLVAPDISDALALKQTALIETAVARANIAAMLTTVGATAGVAVFGRYILAAFGPVFVSAYPLLLTLVAAQLIRAGFGPSVLTLVSAGAQKSVLLVFSITIVILALGNLLLVPIFGAIGAVAAFVVMTAFWPAALAVVLKRKTGLRADIVASFSVLHRMPRSFTRLSDSIAAKGATTAHRAN